MNYTRELFILISVINDLVHMLIIDLEKRSGNKYQLYPSLFIVFMI